MAFLQVRRAAVLFLRRGSRVLACFGIIRGLGTKTSSANWSFGFLVVLVQLSCAAIELGAFYETLPSYRRVLDLEGVEKAGEVFVIGDEESVARQLRRYVDAGATELTLSQTNMLGAEAELRTWRLGAEFGRSLN